MYNFTMPCETHILIIQPPFVQLNGPYPSGAYLRSFFSKLRFSDSEFSIGKISWIDTSNILFHRIFSKEGLSCVFSLSQRHALELADEAEKNFFDEKAFNLRRYIAQRQSWVRWIDVVKEILTGSNQEQCHEFVRSPAVPRGHRMESFLTNLQRDVSVDDAKILASLAIADLADYICTAFDSEFSLIRYGEALASNKKKFSDMEKELYTPVLDVFYEPVLNEIAKKQPKTGRILVCVSCPFLGTLAGALFAGKKMKEFLGERVFVAMGGGYVNTEMRFTKENGLSKYVDALSFDRGYGSYISLFSELSKETNHGSEDFSCLDVLGQPLYKMRLFRNDDILDFHDSVCEESKKEDFFCQSIVPDYSDMDFSCYPCLADTRNPMHRLWSDGTWLKAYLAHGCYWHKCAFCDTTLDYVCAYKKVNVEKLHESLYKQAMELGAKGIHFVDEAAPPVALKDFAMLNLRKENPLSFWGNIRYEKVFNRDVADLLSHAGMIGVSGGIEIASGTGLDAICKGTDIDSIVSSCAAFKEAGILTHAYMIYGYWTETPQMLIDSMETLRQFFAEGLLDSAFWHKFVLTRHSRIFSEYKKGCHMELKPIDCKGNAIQRTDNSFDADSFASNDLRFMGEEKSSRYRYGLEQSLSSWMQGLYLEKPVRSWFDFPMPKPTVPADYVKKSLDRYEKQRNAMFHDYYEFVACGANKFLWLAGNPFVVSSSGLQLCWAYMGEIFYADFPPETSYEQAQASADFLASLSPKNSGRTFESVDNLVSKKLFKKIRGNGLCRYKR